VRSLALQYASTALTVLAILGINTVLGFTSTRLTLFEKHHTRSQQARSLTHKLFLSQVRRGGRKEAKGDRRRREGGWATKERLLCSQRRGKATQAPLALTPAPNPSQAR
jgi:hypothetical protein